MSYGWDNCLRTELRTTFCYKINCKFNGIKIRINVMSINLSEEKTDKTKSRSLD